MQSYWSKQQRCEYILIQLYWYWEVGTYSLSGIELYIQGTKIFKYCTCPAEQVTYNFHSYCKHMHLSFKSVCIKEHKGVIRALTRILKTGVPEPSLPKSVSPTIHLQKIGVPAPKMGVQDCKSAVNESSGQ